MSPYEVIYLMNEFEMMTINILLGYASILFAFLVAGFLIANQLSRFMVVILVLLYTMFSYGVALGGITKLHDLAALAALAALAQETLATAELFQLPMTEEWAERAYHRASAFATVMYAVSYLGSLIFFFAMRKRPYTESPGAREKSA